MNKVTLLESGKDQTWTLFSWAPSPQSWPSCLHHIALVKIFLRDRSLHRVICTLSRFLEMGAWPLHSSYHHEMSRTSQYNPQFQACEKWTLPSLKIEWKRAVLLLTRNMIHSASNWKHSCLVEELGWFNSSSGSSTASLGPRSLWVINPFAPFCSSCSVGSYRFWEGQWK